MRKLVLVFILFSNISQSQQKSSEFHNLVPTELEQAQLAKLKAQYNTLQVQLQSIDTQAQALQLYKQVTQQQQQQKNSELLGLAQKIKESHNDWGDTKDINYDFNNGEYGIFTRQQKEIKK